MIGKSKIPLQTSFLFGNTSLKSIKSEIILTFALELFDDYYRLKDDSCTKAGVISLDLKSDDDIVIENCVDELSTYLRDTIIKKSDLLEIFSNMDTNDGLLLAKQCEPLGVYYEKLAKLLMHYIPVGGLFIPEYFAILLIHYYRSELQGSFLKYSYIDNYDFQKILGVYERVNITIKKKDMQQNPNKRLWESRTTLDEMEKIALYLLKEYDKFQYKVNIMRKSKTRRKKK